MAKLITIKTPNELSVSNGSEMLIFKNDHPYFERVEGLVKDGDFKAIKKLYDKKAVVVELFGGNGYEIAGMPVSEYVVNKINQFKENGWSLNSIYRFMENLAKNPSGRVYRDLYEFLDKGNMPITEDGCFYAYKKVRSDYKDIHTGTIDNSIGEKVKMKRNLCDDDPSRTCSSGLHACSQSYLPFFGSVYGYRVVMVKINPKDVVAIPLDYNLSKLRCCKYIVVEDVTDSYLESGIEDRQNEFVDSAEEDWSDDDDVDMDEELHGTPVESNESDCFSKNDLDESVSDNAVESASEDVGSLISLEELHKILAIRVRDYSIAKVNDDPLKGEILKDIEVIVKAIEILKANG